MKNDWIAKAATSSERLHFAGLQPKKEQIQVVIDDRRKQWITSAASGDEKLFRELLRQRGLDYDEWLLSLSDYEIVDENELPDWVADFKQLWQRLESMSTCTKEQFGTRAFSFLPWYICGEKDLDLSIKSLQLQEIFPVKSRLGMLEYLVERLNSCIWQALTSMNIELEYSGDDSGAWLLKFWNRVYNRFPALTRITAILYKDWLFCMQEMLSRFASDQDKINQHFFGNDDKALGVLTKIECGTGDPHDGGRSVAVFSFTNGKLVYKPKRLGMTAAFSKLLKRFYKVAPHEYLKLKIPDFMDCGDYGWEACVVPGPCNSESEVKLFYGRLGAWQRLLELLNAADYWFDNLFACGAFPIFIDHEMLIQPQQKIGQFHYGGSTEYDPSLDLSAIFLGIMPIISDAGGQSGMPSDISCVAKPGWHRTPLEMQPDQNNRSSSSANKETDKSRVSDEGYIEWHETRYAPGLDGKFVDFIDYIDVFESAYADMQAFLKTEVARKELRRFIEDLQKSRLRYILIDTWTCYKYIKYFTAPQFLGDGVRAEIAREGLWRIYQGIPPAVIQSAIVEFSRGDVPLYVAMCGSRTIKGTGDFHASDFFEKDALSLVQQNIDNLDNHDAPVAIDLLRAAFSTRTDYPRRLVGAPVDTASCLDKGKALNAAVDIGDAISKAARGAKKDSWLGVGRYVGASSRSVVVLQDYLLVGKVGLGIYYARLWRATGETRFKTQAEKLLQKLLAKETETPFLPVNGVGGFMGAGAWILGIAKICKLLAYPFPKEKCTTILDRHGQWEGYTPFNVPVDYATGILGFLHALGQVNRMDSGLDLLPWVEKSIQFLTSADGIKVRRAVRDNDGQPSVARSLQLAMSEWPQFSDEINRMRSEYGELENPVSYHDWMSDLFLAPRISLPKGWQKALKQKISQATTTPEKISCMWASSLAGEVDGVKWRSEAQGIATNLYATYQQTGRWFPEEWAPDHYLLSLFDGMPAIGSAMLSLYGDETHGNTTKHPFWV